MVQSVERAVLVLGIEGGGPGAYGEPHPYEGLRGGVGTARLNAVVAPAVHRKFAPPGRLGKGLGPMEQTHGCSTVWTGS